MYGDETNTHPHASNHECLQLRSDSMYQ